MTTSESPHFHHHFSQLSQASNILGTPSFRDDTTSSVAGSCYVGESHAGTHHEDTQQEFILTVAWRAGKLGAAYYDTISHELHVVADVMERRTEILKALLFQVKPSTLIVKSKLEPERLSFINRVLGIRTEAAAEQQAATVNPGDDSLEVMDQDINLNQTEELLAADDVLEESVLKNCKLHFVPSVFFNLDAARRRLMNLRLRSQPEDMSDTEKQMYLKSIFPLNYPTVVQATGALLRVLESWKRGQDVDRLLDMDHEKCSTVTAIRVHRLEDLVWMDQSTFLTLQIFSNEAHPASAKTGQASSAKEGLSLFGITSKCFSPPGYIHLRNIFLRPTRNIETLKQRYSVIQFCKRTSNLEIFNGFVSCLRSISNIKAALSSIAIMQGTVAEWKKILTTTTHLMALSEMCKSLPQEIELFHQLSRCEESGNLHYITNVIHRMISFEESKRAGRVVINFGVDEDLDQLKRAYSNMPRIYCETASKEIEDLPPDVEQALIEFLPQLGHCLRIRSWLPEGVPITRENAAIPGLEMKFFTDQDIYFKTPRCQELDETYGDFHSEIVKHEMALVLSASNVVLEKSQPLVDGIELAGYLDALLSLTILSTDFDLVEPELVTDPTKKSELHIKEGKHILQQLCVDDFNPNSTNLGGNEHKRINIITGPNSSGKSVYLKQVALIVYMAHIGCFVPAQSVRLSPVTHIFAINHTPESAAVSLSQFGIELTMISAALREASNTSLIIIDEFGQGTSTVDGSALFISAMEYWMRQEERSPLILVATHLHSAANYLSKSLNVSNTQYMSMGYTFQDGHLVFLYHPVTDLCGNSFPFSVAHSVGVPDPIISRAKEVFKTMEEGNNLTPCESLFNELKSQRYRDNTSGILQLDFDDVADIKQFIKRNIVATWSSANHIV